MGFDQKECDFVSNCKLNLCCSEYYFIMLLACKQLNVLARLSALHKEPLLRTMRRMDGCQIVLFVDLLIAYFHLNLLKMNRDADKCSAGAEVKSNVQCMATFLLGFHCRPTQKFQESNISAYRISLNSHNCASALTSAPVQTWLSEKLMIVKY